MFLLPICIKSFVVKDKTIFLDEKAEANLSPTVVVALKELNIAVDLDDYIIGVVAGEMPALFEEEALKAQAVAARSYAASKLKNQEITISPTINDQVFLTKAEMQAKWGSDYELFYNKIKKCVLATKDEVLKREDQILKTFYFAMSNGYTEDSLTVFNDTTFTSTESKWDNDSLANFEVKTRFTTTEIIKALKIAGESIQITNIVRNKTNHVEKITVNGQEFIGTKFRQALSLRSTDFMIEQDGNDYLITTKGYGHGVGMSQYGANGMAKEGYNYQDILKHYYNDVKIENL